MDTPKVAPLSGEVERKVEEKYQKNKSSLQHNCNIAACSTGPYTTSYIKGNQKRQCGTNASTKAQKHHSPSI